MRKWIVLTVIAALACASQAASLKQGTQEIVVEGLFDPDTAADQQLDLSLGYGQFIQDNLEVGGEVAFSDNDVATAYGFAGLVEYNFDQGTEIVPFVGASLGWAKAEVDVGDEDFDNDALVLGVSAGLKYFLAENVAVSGDVTYEWASDEIYDSDDGLEDTDLTLNLGMRFYIP